MGRFIDLTGQRFGRFVVLNRAKNSKDGHVQWNCICDCGTQKVVAGYDLRCGHTRSCGCLNREMASERLSNARRKANSFRPEGALVYVEMPRSEKEMIADLAVWERAKGHYWCLDNRGYAFTKIRKNGEWKRTSFHAFVLPDCPPGMVRDHINGNRLDNRISNLRVVSRLRNAQNAKTRCDNTSGYKGVYWNAARQKWWAEINADSKRIYLGLFSDIQDAIAAREAAEIKYFGEYRRRK